MSDNHIMMVNIANLSSLAQSVFPDAVSFYSKS